MMSPTLSTASEVSQTDAAKNARTASWERLGILYARIALGSAFLSPVADRFGLWGMQVGETSPTLRATRLK